MILVLSILIFVTTSTTLGILLCDLFGSLTNFIALFSLFLGLGAGALTFLKLRNEVPGFKIRNRSGRLMTICFVIFMFRHFLWTVFEKKGSVYVSDASNFVDLPKHILYINFFSRGAHFWPADPYFLNGKLTYYFGTDFFSSLFTKLGASYVTYVPFMGFIAALLLIVTLYFWGGAFALGAFVFSGGAYSLKYFSTFQLEDYQLDMAWRNLVPIFSSQRGYLYAFPAGLILLWSWRKRFFLDLDEKEPPLPALVEGLLWGTMPFFQTYTFFFLSFVFVCWTITTKKIKSSLPTLFWATPIAIYEVTKVTNWFEAKSLIKFHLGWMIKNDNVFLFFWNNYGLFAPLAVVMTFISFRNSRAFKQLLPGTLLYGACFLILFAPYDWDNNKIMIWSYLASLPLMYDLCLRPLPPRIRTFVLILLFIPGLISVGIKSSPKYAIYPIYEVNTQKTICAALDDYPPELRVASAQIHLNPFLLCGQSVVAPYGSLFWSLGHNAEPTQANLYRLMVGKNDWRLIAKDLQARFLFWGPNEEKQFPGSTRPWESSSKIIAQGPWGKLYDLGE